MRAARLLFATTILLLASCDSLGSSSPPQQSGDDPPTAPASSLDDAPSPEDELNASLQEAAADFNLVYADFLALYSTPPSNPSAYSRLVRRTQGILDRLEPAFDRLKQQIEIGLEAGRVPVRDSIMRQWLETFEDWLANQRQQTDIFDDCGTSDQELVLCVQENALILEQGLRLAAEINRLQAENSDLSSFLG